jgi:pimeloyl-ACP methyl ester carboxylesterase
MAFLEKGPVKLYYETHGDTGPVIVLTHGFSATSQMWRGQIDTLSKDHRLILWDMRGHGRSDYPDDPSEYNEKATVEDIAALLDAVGAKKAIVGGLSLGGYMSLAFYTAHPDRVSALLIIDTGPGFKNDEAREAWNKNALGTASKLEIEGLSFLKSTSPERATSEHRSSRGLVNAARGMLTQTNANVINSLPEIKVPSLVIVGANDTAFLNAADYMAKRIPGAQKIVLPNAGHASNIDQPGIFNRAVWDFLEGGTRLRV